MHQASISIVRKSVLSLFVSLALMFALAAPASAQPVVTGGLVNVTVTDIEFGNILSNNDVKLGVALALAASICDVNVNVLAVQLRDGGATCESATDSVTISQTTS